MVLVDLHPLLEQGHQTLRGGRERCECEGEYEGVCEKGVSVR